MTDAGKPRAEPLAPPRDITIPDPGARTARDVLSRSLGRLVRDLTRLDPSFAGDAAGDLAVAVDVARRLASAPTPRGIGALVSTLRSPTTGALVRSLRDEAAREIHSPARRAELARELAATLLFDLAFVDALDEPARLTRLPSRTLSMPARASISWPDDARGAVFRAGAVDVERAHGATTLASDAVARGSAGAPGVAVAHPFNPLDRLTLFATEDVNPRAAFPANPGDLPNEVDLGGRDAPEWLAPLREALGIIGDHMPTLRDEIDLYVRQIVPVGWHEEQHRSASYREAIGSVYMTLHPDLMTLTEAIVHEFSHNKLHALLELDPLIEPTSGRKFRSPVRAEPRPLRGVLLAVHAFLPVARLYETMIDRGHALAKRAYFHERYAKIRAMNDEAARVVLENARPTAVGAGVLDEIARWTSYYRAVGATSA